mgnify:CR=1 FL=1
MLNFLAIFLIIIILLFLFVFKRKYITKAFNIKKFYSNEFLNNKEKAIKTISKRNNFTYQNKAKKYSEFHKKHLIKKMFKLFQSHTEDKLKALAIAEDLADNSTLPILRRGLKDMSPEVVKRSATLIRKFK